MKQTFSIAGIPQGSLHKYWKSIHAGGQKAVRELLERGIAVELAWNAPLREDDRDEQERIVEGFVKKGVDGMMLAPFDSRSLVRSVEEAAAAGIPTVVIDSALDSATVVSYIATDNRRGGALGAERMGELLCGKGKVLVLRYQRGSASTEEREEGFIERLRQLHPAISIISSDEYAGATRDTAKQASEVLLAKHATDVQGIFTPNESSTAGMLMALQAMQLSRKFALVGFDASDMYVDSMRYKQIQGLVVQDPLRIGELGVKTLVDHLQGRAVPKRVVTNTILVTPENMDKPEIQQLLHPPVAR
ncbi:MAG TPA: substrate-binding domain-containing protein [Candidatus Cybelea sp.]|nr:substrate-binding domain-containing protein [Candidatus Cybelea sp.]